MTLREKIGQMVVTGFQGECMSEEFVELVRKYKVANTILFSYNSKSRSQLKTLCASVQKLVWEVTGTDAFITMDQEGGVVARLPEDSLHVPGAMAIASAGDVESAYLAALYSGRELKRLGVNFNLAPVLDINSNDKNPVIGVRSFGSEEKTVSDYGCAMVRGYLDAGILCSIKHFPGHGDTAVDSHVSLPCVDKSYEELKNFELIPFQRAIEEGAAAVTLAHILFPQIERAQIPATMSAVMIQDILRGDLGFSHLIISDCMEMDAIKKYYGTVQGAKNAVKAGVDLIFISHTAQTAKEAVLAIEEAVECGEIPLARIDEAVGRILKFKKIAANHEMGEGEVGGDGQEEDEGEREVDGDGQEADGNEQEARQEFESGGEGGAAERKFCLGLTRKTVHYTNREIEYCHKLGRVPVFLGCGAYRSTLASNNVDGDLLFSEYFSQRFGGDGFLFSVQPDEEEINNVVERVKTGGYSDVVAATYNGHLNMGQIHLIQRLGGLGLPMVLAALRNPGDLDFVDDRVDKIAAYEYSREVFEAIGDGLVL